MKRNRMIIAIALVCGFAPLLNAQGTLYLSNLGSGSSGSLAVASDAWAAESFQAGFNYPEGYILNSIDLQMSNSSGNPSGFSISIWQPNRTQLLGDHIGNLSGIEPSAAGIFPYAPTSPISLAPSETYIIVATSLTSVAGGSYFWNQADSDSYSTAVWPVPGSAFSSTDGMNWTRTTFKFPLQFAIYATPVPEPSMATLVFLGSGILFYVRARNKRRC